MLIGTLVGHDEDTLVWFCAIWVLPCPLCSPNLYLLVFSTIFAPHTQVPTLLLAPNASPFTRPPPLAPSAFAAGMLLMYVPEEVAFKLYCRLLDDPPAGAGLRRLYQPGLDPLK